MARPLIKVKNDFFTLNVDKISLKIHLATSVIIIISHDDAKCTLAKCCQHVKSKSLFFFNSWPSHLFTLISIMDLL